MTEFDIQKCLFDKFLELNEYSNIEFLKKDEDGNYTNVNIPNIPFSAPADKTWFELYIKSNTPYPVAVLDGSQDRITGVFYIDIITPIDVGEDEAETKYRWICRLFNNNIYIDDVVINSCCLSTKGNELDHYRLQVAIEWEADIDKEM